MSHENPPSDGKAAPAELLTRSRTEIAEILGAVAAAGSPVTIYLEKSELLLLTRILHVDANAGCIVLDYGFSKSANATLLSTRTITLHCEHGHSHVQFLASAPTEIAYDEEPAIRLDFPEFLIQHHRRAHPRIRIPPQLRCKCVVECPGFIPFELEIVDIHHGGQGVLLQDPRIRLEPGTVLKGCRIKHPLRHPISVDLDIRYCIGTQLPDGTPVRRLGCRFIGDAGEIEDLVKMFTVALGAAGSA